MSRTTTRIFASIQIPLNEETFKESVMDGQDVELKYAINALEK
ncbi:hypothetical protein [Paenibacillus sp. TH7-28]